MRAVIDRGLSRYTTDQIRMRTRDDRQQQCRGLARIDCTQQLREWAVR
jgi:hypothetical protein